MFNKQPGIQGPIRFYTVSGLVGVEDGAGAARAGYRA